MAKKRKRKQAVQEAAEPQFEQAVSEIAPESAEPPDDPAVAEIVEEKILQTPEPEDEMTQLQRQLQETQVRADEYLDDLRRERAAFQNYKRRQEAERVEMRQQAQSFLLMDILPILDDFERALQVIPPEAQEAGWFEGIMLIQRKLQNFIELNGVSLIEVEPGQEFDPFLHQAITHEENENYQEGQIIAQVQRGYKLGERVLRPSMVRVAKG